MLDIAGPCEHPSPKDEAPLDAYSRAVTAVVGRVGPAVVRVESLAEGRRHGGIGSGVIIAGDGLVLTNSHVIAGTKRARLAFAEAGEAEAQILGDDPDTDLALLRTELPSGAPAAVLGDSKALRRGQLVVAIGNPLGFEFHRHGRGRVGTGALFTRPERSAHRRRDPDRRGTEPWQLWWPARREHRRGGRHQHCDDQRRAGHLLCRREQHRRIRRQRDHPARARASCAYRDRGTKRAAAAAAGPCARERSAGRRDWPSRVGWTGSIGWPARGRRNSVARRRPSHLN